MKGIIIQIGKEITVLLVLSIGAWVSANYLADYFFSVEKIRRNRSGLSDNIISCGTLPFDRERPGKWPINDTNNSGGCPHSGSLLPAADIHRNKRKQYPAVKSINEV